MRWGDCSVGCGMSHSLHDECRSGPPTARRGRAAAAGSVSGGVGQYGERTLGSGMSRYPCGDHGFRCTQPCVTGGHRACGDGCGKLHGGIPLACPPDDVQESGEAGASSGGGRGTTGPSRFAPRARRRGETGGCPSRRHNSPQRVCRRRFTANRAFSAAGKGTAPRFPRGMPGNHFWSIPRSTIKGPYFSSSSRAREMRVAMAALDKPVRV